MTEYPEDYPTLSAGPPPVTYSDRVYDYPADPRPSWQTPLAIAGAALAVIALVIAAVALAVRPVPPDWPSTLPSTVTSTVAAPPSVVTQRSTVTLPPPPPPAPRTSTVTVPVPIPPAPPQSVSACLQLRNQANADYSPTATQAWALGSAAQLQTPRPRRRRHHLGLQLDPGRTPSAEGALRREAVVVGGLAAHLRPRRLLGHRRGIHLRHRRGGQAVVPGSRS